MSDFKQSSKKQILQKHFNSKMKCGLCGCQLSYPAYIDLSNKEYNHLSPNAAQVDHIYPKSKGGQGVHWNAQVLCRHCNRKKSDDTTANKMIQYKAKKILHSCVIM